MILTMIIIMIALKGAIKLEISYPLLTAPRTVSDTYVQVART